jgi:hypothetical protein
MISCRRHEMFIERCFRFPISEMSEMQTHFAHFAINVWCARAIDIWPLRGLYRLKHRLLRRGFW